MKAISKNSATQEFNDRSLQVISKYVNSGMIEQIRTHLNEAFFSYLMNQEQEYFEGINVSRLFLIDLLKDVSELDKLYEDIKFGSIDIVPNGSKFSMDDFKKSIDEITQSGGKLIDCKIRYLVA